MSNNNLTALRAVKYVLFLLLVVAVTLVFLPEPSASNTGAEVSLEEQKTTTLAPTHTWSRRDCYRTLDCVRKVCDAEGTDCHPGTSTPCVSRSGGNCKEY